jgi:hypothetical protein
VFVPGLIQGRWLDTEDLEALRWLIAEHPHWSRRRLSIALCEVFDWRTASGQLKDIAHSCVSQTARSQGLIQEDKAKESRADIYSPFALADSDNNWKYVRGCQGNRSRAS